MGRKVDDEIRSDRIGQKRRGEGVRAVDEVNEDKESVVGKLMWEI